MSTRTRRSAALLATAAAAAAIGITGVTIIATPPSAHHSYLARDTNSGTDHGSGNANQNNGKQSGHFK
jgi:hypothetical protein